MSTSPSLRLSLRRKRSTIRITESSGSPATKKGSPTPQEGKKEPPSTPKSRNKHRAQTRIRSATRTSPRLAKNKDSKSCDTKKNEETPKVKSWAQPEDCMRHPSPDMPLLSSQLCGTQDCEVVWDCDSPDFSKDDLKRMHSSDGPLRILPVTEAPHRQLFPKARTRLPQLSSLGNTTAQLNDLLDLLSSKESEGREKVIKEDPNSHKETLNFLNPMKDSASPPLHGSSSSESPVMPIPLKDTSQPFEVGDVASNSDQPDLPTDTDDSMWGEDLNLGMCDISENALDVSVGAKSNKESKVGSTEEIDMPKVPLGNADLSSTSTDIFDDDLFSESVILCTQAVEDEMTRKDTISEMCSKKTTKENSKELNFKDVISDVHDYQEKNNSSVRTSNRDCKKPEVTTYSKFTPDTHNIDGKINSEVSMVCGSVIDQKEVLLEAPLKRQVRRSFRLGNSPSDVAKSVPSRVTEKTSHTVDCVSEKERLIGNMNIRSGVDEVRKSGPLLRVDHKSSTRVQKPSIYNLISDKLSVAPASSNAQNTCLTKLLPIKKALFKSSESKPQEKRQGSSVQAVRGPLLRSQSSSDAQFITSSPLARRSNSSVELDATREFEDDDFFKSLLSVLPEEEGGFGDDCTMLLHPMSERNNPSEFQHCKKLSWNTNVFKENTRIKESKEYERKKTNSHAVKGSLVKTSGHQGEPSLGVTKTKATSGRPPDTGQGSVGVSEQPQNNDTFDDGLFEDDVLSLIDEVESQFGSQKSMPEATPSPQSPHQQPVRCTQDEIARKKAAAFQRREEKRRQQYR